MNEDLDERPVGEVLPEETVAELHRAPEELEHEHEWVAITELCSPDQETVCVVCGRVEFQPR